MTDGRSTDGESTDGKSTAFTTDQMTGESYHLSDHTSEAIASSVARASADGSGSLKPKAKGRAPARKQQIADDWRLDDQDIAYARQHGMSAEQIELAARKFVRWHKEQRKARADFHLAWENWVDREKSNVVRFEPRSQRSTAAEDIDEFRRSRGLPPRSAPAPTGDGVMIDVTPTKAGVWQ
jgi:hypothetical protein